MLAQQLCQETRMQPGSVTLVDCNFRGVENINQTTDQVEYLIPALVGDKRGEISSQELFLTRNQNMSRANKCHTHLQKERGGERGEHEVA